MKTYHWIAGVLVGFHVVVGCAGADDVSGSRRQPLQGGDDTREVIESLKKQIEVLNEKVKALENRQAVAVTAVDQKAKATPMVTAGADGFTIQSADTNFVLGLHGVSQFDWHYYGSPAWAKDTMTIRRLRAIAQGTFYQNIDYYVQTDFGSGTTATTTNNAFLQDAYVNFHYWNGFQIQAGKFKEPVSLEILPPDAVLWFVERGLPTELAPNRDVGVEVHGDLFHGALSYAAGAFNGVPDGGSGDVETADSSKDVVGRIFALPFKNTKIKPLQGLGFGLGSSYGLQAGTTPAYATLGRQTFFSYTNGVTPSGQHLRLDPQGYYFWGPFGLFAEYAISDQKFQHPVSGKNQAANLNNTGWNVDASWYLTGETNTMWGIPAPLKPFDIHGGGWGALQLAARIGQLSMDGLAFSGKAPFAAAGSAQDITSWGIGLNWYPNKNVKFIFDYEQAAFSGGMMGGLKGNGPVTAQDEKSFLGRLQFSF